MSIAKESRSTSGIFSGAGVMAKRFLMLTSFALLLGGTAAVSYADEKTDALVKERQDLMKKMGGTFKVLVPIVKGENTNLSDAVPAATTVHEASKGIVAAFPEGSGRDEVPESRAKREIWLQWAEFEAAAEKLVEESGKLVDAAESGDVEAFRAQFKVYAAACGGCHEGPSKSGGKFRFERE